VLLNDEAAYGFVRDPRVYSSATESRSDGVISTGPLGVLSWANYALLTVTTFRLFLSELSTVWRAGTTALALEVGCGQNRGMSTSTRT
jgi:hypothetical protein